jgi:hypothetical protein
MAAVEQREVRGESLDRLLGEDVKERCVLVVVGVVGVEVVEVVVVVVVVVFLVLVVFLL